ETRRLAGVQRAEEQELHELELLRLADRDEQGRQRIRLHRAAIELEAENEVVRLERLDSRIREYPTAMQWDVESRRLDVAAALASNTRAMVQVGPGIDVASSLLMQTPAGDAQPDGANGQPVQSGQASSRQRGGETRSDIDGAARESSGGSGAAMFLGALLDGIPESTILGITLALGGTINVAFLTAVFVSNVPEGIAGTINLRAAGYTDRRILG